MGRSPCCDKLGLKRGPWTPEEDQKLLAYIEEHGHGNWRALPARAGLQRCGKSCRLRWTNYLRPDIKRGKFSLQEEQTIIQLHALLGNRWSAIATHLPKRTDNEIKNYWNTHLKKRLAKMGIDPVTHKPKNDAILLTGDGAQQTRNAATLSHMAQWESARLEAEARLARQSKLRSGPSGPPSFLANHHPPHHINNNFNSTSTRPRCLDVLKAWHSVWPSTSTITDPTASGVGPGGGGFGPAGSGVRLGIESPTSTLSFSENAPPVPTVGTATGAVIQFMESNHNSQVEQGLGKEKGEQEWKRGFDHHHDSHNHNHYQNHHDHGRTMMTENSLSFSASSGLNDIMEANADNNDEDQDVDDVDNDHDHDQSFMEGFTELLLGAATTTTNTCSQKSQEEDQEGGAMTDNNNNNDDNNSGGGGSGSTSSSGSDYYEDNKNYWNSILNLVNSSPSHSPMF